MRKKTASQCCPSNGRTRGQTACECLDFVEASHRHRVYPVIYCHMEIKGHLDLTRLKDALQQTSRLIPEILYVFDFKKGIFTDIGLRVDDIILWGKQLYLWDLSRKPQLQISIHRTGQRDTVIVGISHILADGNGFLQYLYLLSSLYNHPHTNLPRENERNLFPLLRNIHVKKQRFPDRFLPSGKRTPLPLLRSPNGGTSCFCMVSQIPETDFLALHEKAKKKQVTLNDLFMTAYARIIARQNAIDTVHLPCPADLRLFHPIKDRLTVANMTGIFKNVVIEVKPRHTFNDTLSQVHLEMERQKACFLCFEGIQLLHGLFRKLPLPLLSAAIKAAYRPLPVSYTNIGMIDHRKFAFHGCEIESCYLTGTYRLPPDFQLSVSTFRHVCTLNCTLIGQSGDEQTGQILLDQVKKELLDWTYAP